mmetsp:Transcript_76712/g.155915  ORF Transcript_76712/g.155915 Transcript_76712/m.155915 type:complete len:173 (+) Transcript_76712:66-584(+)
MAPSSLDPPRGAVRDVDKLLAVTDGKLAEDGAAYMEKHQINAMLGELVTNLVTLQPKDPLQYIIDSVEFSPEFARQDPETGLPEHRRSKLEDVFKLLDKEGLGSVSFDGLQQYSAKHGGGTLGDDDLQSMFTDFAPSGGTRITLPEFLAYFAKVSRTMPNPTFATLVADLMA